MKKILLSGIAVLSFMTASFAQTSLTDFDGTAGNINNDNSAWYSFDAVATPYIVNTAVTGSSGNYLKLSGTASGYYVGGVGYNNTTSMGLGATIDNLSFRLTTSGNTTTQVKIELYTPAGTFSKQVDYGSNTAVQSGWVIQNWALSSIVDGSANAPDPTAITKIQIQLLVSGPVGTVNGLALIDDIKFSTGAVTSSVNNAANIASSKLYPNPVSDMAKVELNLKSASNVKVVLSDVMGKEVMTIAEGTFAELAKDFSVANLNKGIYTVNYYINGEAAKAEMLMVK